ncbi:MAG TPA: hypothetical protein GX706_02070 [Candidatus Moranbacteria bacterium]|nr:hypothetical protein [Candidatus Moranbacteria bacterium]
MAGKTKSKAKKKEDSFKDGLMLFVREVASKFTSSFLANFIEQVKEETQSKIDETIIRVKQLIATSFLVMTGVIFSLIGLALILESVFNFPGTGFLILGVFFLLVAFLFSFANKKINS